MTISKKTSYLIFIESWTRKETAKLRVQRARAILFWWKLNRKEKKKKGEKGGFER